MSSVPKQVFFNKVKVVNMKKLLKTQKKSTSGSKQELFDRLSIDNIKKLTKNKNEMIKTKPKVTRKAPNISATDETLKVGDVKKGLDGDMWILKTTSSGTRRWFKYKTPSKNKKISELEYRKAAEEKIKSDRWEFFKRDFTAGKTNKWAGLPVSKELLSERNKMIIKLKKLDKDALNMLGKKMYWNPRFLWMVQEGSTQVNTPAEIVSYMKWVFDNSSKDLKNDLKMI